MKFQWKRKARRIYFDLVRRRSRLLITAAEPTKDLGGKPIFLVGLYRSGTTLLRYVIDSHTRICCPPESHFIGMLSPLVNSRKGSFGFSGMGFGRDHVIQRIRVFVSYFFSNYASSHGKERWADKSPSYVDHLLLIEELFPEAQFVMIYRHPLDQIHSHTQGGEVLRPHLEAYHKEGEDYRIAGARYWREKTEQMLAFERDFSDKCFRIRYEDFASKPEPNLRSLFEFLKEPWEPEVLEFYKFDHVVGLEDGKVVSSRGFVVSSGHYHTWREDLIDQCYALVSPTMSSLGYS